MLNEENKLLKRKIICKTHVEHNKNKITSERGKYINFNISVENK